ncbi:MAG: hypothetical protein M0P44_01790 [Clostridiales bacterium]|jgi:hypothetical protein|nr:hypothetical protein [Clostridiales bacterium]MDD3540400.1 hypothetical protein [Eubacteriales bacterium]
MANTSNKYWYVVGSPLMNIAIPKKYFEVLAILVCPVAMRTRIKVWKRPVRIRMPGVVRGRLID